MASSPSSSQRNKNAMNKISKKSSHPLKTRHDDGDITLNSKTPEKPISRPATRTRNPNVAMSLNDIRTAAKNLRKSSKQDREDPILSSSAKRQILMYPTVNPAIEPDNKDSGANNRPNVLPEKYQMLVDLFNYMDSSIRLIRLKGPTSVPTFTNIRRSVETLSDRRFTYGHLAQMKFILPEAFVLKKVMSFDERSSCMKPDLHVYLDSGAVQSDLEVKPGRENSRMRKVFRSRLVDFVKSHPEGGDVPEGELPGPSGRVTIQPQIEATESSNSSSHVDTPAISNTVQLPAVESHFPGAFRRHFSLKASCQDSETTLQKHIKDSSPPLATSAAAKIHVTPTKLSSTSSKLVDSTPPPSVLSPKAKIYMTPTKLSSTSSKPVESKPQCSVLSDTAKIHETPTKFSSTPAELMNSTPAQQTPKRCLMSPDDDSFKSPNKLFRRPLPTKSLKFNTPVKSTEVEDMKNTNSDIYHILGEDLLSKIQEKERSIMEESDPAISQAKRRRDMIAGLPKLLNVIYLIYQSINKSVITKNELMHKIIANHLDITDRGELEEQVLLLQELVPEWISEKLQSSGDRVLRINKSLNTQIIRARLAEAQ